MNLESPSGAGARLPSRLGMLSNWADVTAALSVVSKPVLNMMLVMLNQKSTANVGPHGHYKYSKLSFVTLSDAVSPVLEWDDLISSHQASAA